MILPRGAQDRHVSRQLVLRMGSHRASNRGPHPHDARAVADFEHSVEPAVLDKAVGLRAGVDVNIRAEAAQVEIGPVAQVAQMFERAGRDDMNHVLVEEISPRRIASSSSGAGRSVRIRSRRTSYPNNSERTRDASGSPARIELPSGNSILIGASASRMGSLSYADRNRNIAANVRALMIPPCFISRSAQTRSPSVPRSVTTASSSASPRIDLTG